MAATDSDRIPTHSTLGAATLLAVAIFMLGPSHAHAKGESVDPKAVLGALDEAVAALDATPRDFATHLERAVSTLSGLPGTRSKDAVNRLVAVQEESARSYSSPVKCAPDLVGRVVQQDVEEIRSRLFPRDAPKPRERLVVCGRSPTTLRQDSKTRTISFKGPRLPEASQGAAAGLSLKLAYDNGETVKARVGAVVVQDDHEAQADLGALDFDLDYKRHPALLLQWTGGPVFGATTVKLAAPSPPPNGSVSHTALKRAVTLTLESLMLKKGSDECQSETYIVLKVNGVKQTWGKDRTDRDISTTPSKCGRKTAVDISSTVFLAETQPLVLDLDFFEKDGDYHKIASLHKEFQSRRGKMGNIEYGPPWLATKAFDAVRGNNEYSDEDYQVELGVATRPDVSGEGQWTDWLTAQTYQAWFDAEVRRKRYPLKVEGANQNGLSVYRGIFTKYPKGKFWFVSHHGLDKSHYDSIGETVAKQGYERVWKQSFTDSQGDPRYQAIWVRKAN